MVPLWSKSSLSKASLSLISSSCRLSRVAAKNSLKLSSLPWSTSTLANSALMSAIAKKPPPTQNQRTRTFITNNNISRKNNMRWVEHMTKKKGGWASPGEKHRACTGGKNTRNHRNARGTENTCTVNPGKTRLHTCTMRSEACDKQVKSSLPTPLLPIHTYTGPLNFVLGVCLKSHRRRETHPWSY